MNSFTYSYPTKVYFGEKAATKNLPAELAKTGKTVMLAYGGGSIKKNGIYDELVGILKEAGKEIVEFTGIMSNPTYVKVQEGARLAKEKNVGFILAVGGGSVIDCCKIVSAQAKSDTDIWKMEFDEHRFPMEFIPMGAVVTAFGTGAEMNCGAVITHEEKNLKNGVMGTFYDFAILDPEYTMTMPMNQVISGAFDSLSHSMETYMGSPREVNYSDEINEATQRNIIRNIRAMLIDPADRQARSELVWAAAMAENGILKLGKVTDFQCHMLEHQLGAYTDCNHGRGLAVLHPVLYRHMMPEANRQFARLAAEVWGVSPDGKSEAELAESFITALSDFIKEIGLPTTLTEMGIADVDLEAIAKSTIRTDGCVKKFTDEELLAVLKECI
ncbi:iron-containing alcohol dehydrogenase [Mogibacterium timidum]|uniref:Putative NADH-dependent butanol dehydrogenase A n=1 Tax=Mogibacterium timidum ATCC 33093 TaxID=1401079 RepID=X8J8E3_9FIRM|nr:iron-containing alcohol dehydrogenase [Mogibacterium timidum]EUC60017.1 putative NADH-dependent butanol dehydrogenase A [Mogibacterium timidum ATCC 33093]